MRKINEKDVAEALVIINMNFSNAYVPKAEGDIDLLVSSWVKMLEGIPYEVFNQALMNVMKHADFAPRIGTIVKECERLMTIGHKTPEELWSELIHALDEADRHADLYSYMYAGNDCRMNALRNLTRIFNSLSEPNKRYCVDVRGFISLCNADLEYEKGRFLKSIGSIKEKIHTEETTPEPVKRIAEEIGKKMRLIDS